jgi:serine/threonine protein kinase
MNRAPPDDSTKTTIRATSPTTAGSGVVSRSSTWGHTLPESTRLGEFEIIGLVGEGGFGIVYLAFDHSLHRRVALKEYMPSSLAARVSGKHTVAVKSQQHTEAFQAGMASFINEARLLAQFDHPALVKVHRFWEANGTAYMVMPYYEGPTLERALSELGRSPDEAWLRRLLDPLLDALAVLHAAQCLHRDVAPDNILLTPAGPLLLDFGAARRVIGDVTRGLTAILKAGYAPIEQYANAEAMRQGPWTDIYAVACVVYRAISGKAPMASIDRLIADRVEPLSRLAQGRYSSGFLCAMDAGLAVSADGRPRDIAEFRALLDADATGAAPIGVATAREAREPERTPGSGLTTVAWYVAGAAAVALTAAAAWWIVSHRAPPAPSALPTGTLDTAVTATMAAAAEEPPPVAVAAAEAQPQPATTSPATTARAHARKSDAQRSPPGLESRNATGTESTSAPRATTRPQSHCDELLHKAATEVLSSEDIESWRKECT